MGTFTASEAIGTDIPVAYRGGIHYTRGTLTLAATITTGSKILLVRVPHGATILDWRFEAGSAAGTPALFDIGTSASPSALSTGLASLTAGTGQPFWYNPAQPTYPFQVSLSDGDNTRHTWLIATQTGTNSASTSIHFQVWYSMDFQSNLVG